MDVAHCPGDCSTGFSFGPLARTSTLAASFCVAERTRAYPGDSNMKWIVLACATLLAGCPNVPTPENQSFPGASQPAVDERRESRAFELADTNCVSKGKDVEAARVEGQMVYTCVKR
jgi:putative hemolysin